MSETAIRCPALSLTGILAKERDIDDYSGITAIPLLFEEGGRDNNKNGAKQHLMERTGW